MWKLSLLALAAASLADDSDAVPLKVPEGFHVSVYADETLVHDIYSMTLDAQGRVVISGRGYIHTLFDNDGDGRADTVQPFADGPRTGAQGMCFDGTHLLASGDTGVIRYRDANGDGVADGPPETLLLIKAGGEHEVHAIRKGPDGYWYVIAGNYAGVTKETITSPNSPVRNPHAGVLLRASPDFKEIDVVGHGFRNAYDFDFNAAGDAFAYDSDGERDISLPWYRPTRVFRVAPGSNAGWVSRSWKRPNDYFDTMPVVANCGRGSPTGVVCYRHRQFPESYRDAIFALDWTYGRVLVVRLDENGEPATDEPELFMSAAGDHGFAPTDAEVAPDGSLVVSVGGRGLRGTVYRVTYGTADVPHKDEGTSALTESLAAPQPLSSWSRANWETAAKRLGSRPFVNTARDQTRRVAERLRAMEILSELYGGVDERLLRDLLHEPDVAIRARAVKAAGIDGNTAVPTAVLVSCLNDEHHRVRRAALEVLLARTDLNAGDEFIKGLSTCLNDHERAVLPAAARVIERLPSDVLGAIDNAVGATPYRLWFLHGAVRREPFDVQRSVEAMRFAISMLRHESSRNFNADAVRLMQIAWGDMGPREGRAAVYDGYAPMIDLSPYEFELEPLKRELAELYRTQYASKPVGYELARLMAMLDVGNDETRRVVLAQITGESDPVDDIHYLIVYSRMPGSRSDDELSRTASALLALDRKLDERSYNTDSNWDDRVGEMYATLAEWDPALPAALINHPDFGRPAHVLFLDQLPEEYLQAAIDAFTKKITAAEGEYPWSTDIVFLLSVSDKPEDVERLREQYENPSLQGAITIALANAPLAEDREKFVAGLASWQYEVLEASTNALVALGAKDRPNELVALLTAVRRLGDAKGEYPLREKLARLLQQASGIDAGFVYGEEGYAPQPAAMDLWTTELSKRYPQEFAGQFGAPETEISDLQQRLKTIDWDSGHADRGRTLFQKRSCGHCHGGSQALGPSLSGVAKRFSQEELFTAIVFPNRDVSPRYQASSVVTTAGKVYHGMIIYESVDGFILRNATLQTHRFESADVESRSVSKSSMMPAGLLRELGDNEWADLYAYLKTLQ